MVIHPKRIPAHRDQPDNARGWPLTCDDAGSYAMIVAEQEATVVSVARPGFVRPVHWSPNAGIAGIRALVDMLGQVTDPRHARGVRHQISVVLTMIVLAVLAGARNFREIADRAADLPPELGYR
jgi:DDE_Tnp_1-associated